MIEPISGIMKAKSFEVMKNFRSRQFCSTVRQRLPQVTELVSDRNGVSVPQAATEVPKLKFGLPIKEDLNSGAVSSNIHIHWSNVPLQTRDLFDKSMSTSSFFATDQTASGMGLLDKAKTYLSIIGKGPVDLALQRGEYCSEYQLEPYKKGMKAAYHWSRALIPRTVAARCPGDLRVDPVDADRSVLLLDQVMDRTTVLFGFSGYDLSGLNTGVKAWKRQLSQVLDHKDVQVLDVHFCEGWLSRRTHPLTRQILRTFTSRDENQPNLDNMFIYRGKWKRDIVLDFHLYNKSLPSIMLIDKRGYIRWHAVGLPTEETIEIVHALLPKLRNEKY